MAVNLLNSLWVLLAALLVFTMTIGVGFLEVGELGGGQWRSLLKTMFMTCAALILMAFLGFDLAFAPTVANGIIGSPTFLPPFLGASTTSTSGLLTGVWWSTAATTDLALGPYFLFEAAFAAVTFALVGVVMVRKVKLRAVALFAVPYFLVIWTLPAAWIWNPSGWLARLGMVDLAGGLVVHAAAGAAGLAVLVRIWQEEKTRGLHESPRTPVRVDPTWLTFAVLLLWIGWFGFNPGSVLAFNSETTVVVLTTFLAASVSFLSVMGCRLWQTGKTPGYLDSANGILMGLIVITPLAGFVSPLSAVILGALCGPLFLLGDWFFGRLRWLSDPIGLLPGHLLGGLFGLGMIAFFAQTPFAAASGYPSLPNGLFFGGGEAAVHQLGIEGVGAVVVIAVVFALSFASIWLIARAVGGITRPETAPAAASIPRENLTTAPAELS